MAIDILVFYTGERPWNAARQLSELVEVDERFESYFHDCKMNLIEIKGNTSYNFNEEDVYNLFYICLYICRSIYDQSIYEGMSNHFGLVKSSVLKVVKTLTYVEWLDLEELEEKEEIEMCEAEKRWLEVKSKEWEAEGIKKGIEQGSEKKELEMYQTMVDKGFSISSIASIFSVSEESIRKLLMKA